MSLDAHDAQVAVLWDLDGTLVDTEPYWIEAEFALVARHGDTWSMDHAHAMIGNDLVTSAVYLQQHGGVRLPAAEIVQLLLDDVIAAIRRAAPWRPGARELLAELRSDGVTCGLVTMSYARLAEVVVAQLPAGSFEVVVTGDMVERGKPHPEPYLLAAGKLGVAPEHCVAIEDSMTGATSATAAGMRVLAVPHLVAVPAAPGRAVVHTLAGLGTADVLAVGR